MTTEAVNKKLQKVLMRQYYVDISTPSGQNKSVTARLIIIFQSYDLIIY